MFVAAATPEYKHLASLGCGVTAKKGSNWISLLKRLQDPEERIAQAQRNRKAVEQLDMAIRWRDWVEVYESLV